MLRLIEIAEGRTGGLWEPIFVFTLLIFSLVAPRRGADGGVIRYGVIRALLLVYYPVYVLSLSLDSWGNLGQTLHFFARLALFIAFIRMFLLVSFEVVLPRLTGAVVSRIVTDIVHGVVYLAGILWLLRGAGLDAVSLLTTGTVLGAVIGLSLQETLGNIFAGLAVQAEEPFRVGEWVAVEGTGLLGQVMEINWRATRIRTEDDEMVDIPNGLIARSAIRNFNAPDPTFELELPFTAPYHVSPGVVRDIAVRAAQRVASLDPRPPWCGITGFHESGVAYRLRFYSRSMPNRREQLSEVAENLWSGLSERGLTVGFPLRLQYQHPGPYLAHTGPAGGVDTAEHQQRFHALARLDFLAPLSIADRQQLADELERLHEPAGAIVVAEGDETPACYLVITGTLLGRDGQGVERTLGMGAYFGELTLMTGLPQPETVVAQTEVSLLRIDPRMLQERLAHSQPEILARIGAILARRCEARQEAASGASAPEGALVEGQIVSRMRRLFGLR